MTAQTVPELFLEEVCFAATLCDCVCGVSTRVVEFESYFLPEQKPVVADTFLFQEQIRTNVMSEF